MQTMESEPRLLPCSASHKSKTKWYRTTCSNLEQLVILYKCSNASNLCHWDIIIDLEVDEILKNLILNRASSNVALLKNIHD